MTPRGATRTLSTEGGVDRTLPTVEGELSELQKIERKYRRARAALLAVVLGYVAATCYYEMKWRFPAARDALMPTPAVERMP